MNRAQKLFSMDLHNNSFFVGIEPITMLNSHVV